MSFSLAELIDAAGQAANSGRWHEAGLIWQEVARQEPNNPKAIFGLAVHAFQNGELTRARDLLIAAHQAAPTDILVLLTLGTVYRERGEEKAERDAIETALAIDPYFIPALLARASWLERFGTEVGAAATYANAVRISPSEAHWPLALRSQLEHARDFVDKHSRALDAHLSARVAGFQATLRHDVAERWREATSIMAGRSRPYTSESNQLHVPRLPAIPFFDRALFPWMAELESKTGAIRTELEALLKDHGDRFSPYIIYKPGDPVNQWQELNHSPRWSAFHLWRSGKPVKENLQRCPQTAKALASVSFAEIDGLCPNAMFSALAPKTHIPPHTGETNARVIVHLPLIVPPQCRYRVGYEERNWKVGEALIFDDTLEHEARNDSDELRVVLIFDVWNPLLSPPERQLVSALAQAAREFGRPVTPLP